jgi:7-cyano-7-deazaguanine synthase
MITRIQDLPRDGRRALLLFSGGFDSTFVGLTLQQGGVKHVCLSIQHPNRPRQERVTAEALSADIGCDKILSVNLDLQDYRRQPGRWPSERHEGWIPFRNVVFFGIAAHYAIMEGCDIIASGVRVWDTTAYTDATLEYLSRLEAMLGESGAPGIPARPLELYLPLIQAHTPIVDFINAHPSVLGTLQRSWSCWRDQAVPCGVCAPCRTRAQFLAGFEWYARDGGQL